MNTVSNTHELGHGNAPITLNIHPSREKGRNVMTSERRVQANEWSINRWRERTSEREREEEIGQLLWYRSLHTGRRKGKGARINWSSSTPRWRKRLVFLFDAVVDPDESLIKFRCNRRTILLFYPFIQLDWRESLTWSPISSCFSIQHQRERERKTSLEMLLLSSSADCSQWTLKNESHSKLNEVRAAIARRNNQHRCSCVFMHRKFTTRRQLLIECLKSVLSISTQSRIWHHCLAMRWPRNDQKCASMDDARRDLWADFDLTPPFTRSFVHSARSVFNDNRMNIYASIPNLFLLNHRLADWQIHRSVIIRSNNCRLRRASERAIWLNGWSRRVRNSREREREE